MAITVGMLCGSFGSKSLRKGAQLVGLHLQVLEFTQVVQQLLQGADQAP